MTSVYTECVLCDTVGRACDANHRQRGNERMDAVNQERALVEVNDVVGLEEQS
jgi:hypothetical protein